MKFSDIKFTNFIIIEAQETIFPGDDVDTVKIEYTAKHKVDDEPFISSVCSLPLENKYFTKESIMESVERQIERNYEVLNRRHPLKEMIKSRETVN